jgi:hypothetical protein
MFADFYEELAGRAVTPVLALLLGGIVGWLISQLRRRQERRSILLGDARDTVAIHYHLIDPGFGSDGERVPATLRIRTLGQAELRHVVPNGHLAGDLRRRARAVTAVDTLISMEGAEGSYLLETLTGFVCDRLANAPFEHDLYVMAPCCEPKELAHHQPVSIILIAVSDLLLFDSWTNCRDIQVEHGSDGARVLTLLNLARRYRKEQGEIARLRESGKRTTFVETMYVLDLPLDKRTAEVDLKPVPWGRFEQVLRKLNLE